MVDIREQFPILDRLQTQVICLALGIRHPFDPRTRTPIVLTTDFVITRQTPGGLQDFAYSVKQKSDLKNKRTVDKLAIEELYWSSRGIEWSPLFHEDLKSTEFQNLSWIMGSLDADNQSIADMLTLGTAISQEALLFSELPINEVCERVDRHFGLARGASLSCLRKMLGRKLATTDLRKPHLYSLPARDFTWPLERHKWM
ncbi:TnsA endonuclease N-terminal domain-containing protein [Microbacteriaceae bacterium K1510]|nr:TnsA endonuclease N-terminal domain-containing protein [Microbacteriaceae bacterium K1510]